jgi:hypothetical protein
MFKTIEGIYQNGKVELAEQPETSGEQVQVLVTFLDASTTDPTKIRQLIERLETIAGIQEGLEELNKGKTRPLNQFVQEMQQKYGISS